MLQIKESCRKVMLGHDSKSTEYDTSQALMIEQGFKDVVALQTKIRNTYQKNMYFLYFL